MKKQKKKASIENHNPLKMTILFLISMIVWDHLQGATGFDIKENEFGNTSFSLKDVNPSQSPVHSGHEPVSSRQPQPCWRGDLSAALCFLWPLWCSLCSWFLLAHNINFIPGSWRKTDIFREIDRLHNQFLCQGPLFRFASNWCSLSSHHYLRRMSFQFYI